MYVCACYFLILTSQTHRKSPTSTPPYLSASLCLCLLSRAWRRYDNISETDNISQTIFRILKSDPRKIFLPVEFESSANAQ